MVALANIPLRGLARLLCAHPLLGVGIALVIRSGLGAAPWDVFHIGVHRVTGLSVGMATTATSLAAVLLALVAGARPGLGTLINALLVGPCVDVALGLLPAAPTPALGFAYEAGGLALFGSGTGLYLSAELGGGPRDSLMLALAQRRFFTLGRARAVIELAVLAVGVLLGGRAGIGTVVYALAIGPVAQWCTRRFVEPT